VLLAGAGYWWTGSPGRPGPALATDAPVAGPAGAASGSESEQIAAMVEGLAKRLKEQPDDATGWAMLGRSYMALGRQADALAAYQQVVKLQPDDAGALADYADMLALSQGSELAGEPTRLIEQALKIEPDNLKALALAGAAAYNRREFGQAVKYWDRVALVGPPDNPMVQQAVSGAISARELGQLPAAAATAAATPAAPATEATIAANGKPAGTAPASAAAAAAAGTVSGTVSLAATLQGQAAASDTVFIFARPAEGSRMPLAILRKQVSDLPFSFQLDDSLSMSPAARLSSAGRVIVGARISKSGQAMPQPGDLEGLSAPTAVGSSGVTLIISSVVK